MEPTAFITQELRARPFWIGVAGGSLWFCFIILLAFSV